MDKPFSCTGTGQFRAFSIATLAMFLTITFSLIQPMGALAQTGLGIEQQETPTETIALPETLTTNDIDALLAPLTDSDARALLKATLEARARELVAARAAADGEVMSPFTLFLERLRNGSIDFSQNMTQIMTDLPQTPAVASKALDLLTDLERWPRLYIGVGNLAAMVLAGFAAAFAVRRLFAGLEGRFRNFEAHTFRHKLVAVLVRAGLKLAEIAAFFVTGQIVSLLVFARFDPMRLFLLAWFSTICVYLLARIVSRILFAPTAPNLRLVHGSDTWANAGANLVVWPTTLFAFSLFNSGMFQLLAVPPSLITVWQVALGTLTFALIAWFMTGRISAAPMAETTNPTSGAPTNAANSASVGQFVRQGLGEQGTLLAFTGLAIVFALWFRAMVAQNAVGAGAVILVLVSVFAAGYVRRIDADDSVVRDLSRAPVSTTTLNFTAGLLLLLAGLGILQAIDLDLVGMASTPLGQELIAVIAKVAATLLVAMIVWSMTAGVIQRYIKREHDKALAIQGDHEPNDDGGSGIVVSRLGTLLPIFRGFAFALLAVITLMFVLSSIGLNIGPLLAGAGVVGIAIGFGAQTLVKDIFSGIFFLVDDAFRLGEYVEFEAYKGEVEKISIRSMQLRHHRGPVHTVPFGELRAITNHNRDWVIFKQEFQLPYETDIEKVRKIVKKIGQELIIDPEYGPSFLAPLKSQGVKRVEGGVLVIGTKFTAKPREQWLLRRVVYQRVRDKLYEAGIELAHRRVQIELPHHDEYGTSDRDKAIAAAAANVIADDDDEKATGAAKKG